MGLSAALEFPRTVDVQFFLFTQVYHTDALRALCEVSSHGFAAIKELFSARCPHDARHVSDAAVLLIAHDQQRP